MTYPVRQKVRVNVTCRDATNALVDPTTLTVRVKDPSGTVTSHIFGVDSDVVKDGIGLYHRDFVLTEPGKWFVKSEGSGNVDISSKELLIETEPSEFYV